MSKTIPIPPAAQERIRALQDEMQALQNLLQRFLDGVLIGMGQDITKPIKVNLEDMTITLDED